MLKLDSVGVAYGQTRVLHGISLEVRSGELVGVIGANGAGKTTALHAICGVQPLRTGTISYEGRSIGGLSVDAIVRLGLSLVPEGRHLFAPMSVKDNLVLGAYSRGRRGKDEHIRHDLEMVYSMFPILSARTAQLAGTLSGGEQQMLAIGRALMARPRLLLLDEPSMGLAPRVMGEIFRVIGELRKLGLTMLLVEQNARWALKVCDRAYVLETGRVVKQGESAELLQDESVKEAYLGKGYKPHTAS